MEPLVIHVHPSDNVAIVANPEGLPAGAVCGGGPVLREAFASGKPNLVDIRVADGFGG